ncbi:hypothetical protein HNR46_002375 [Haloferula luteola]|uniref:Uncharacterized protein n=1 Tax=Haloferula luteola TaxID=595692 RepID=A0A840V967_9BACT|nr:hypothetical protein [Haloferula luteola]
MSLRAILFSRMDEFGRVGVAKKAATGKIPWPLKEVVIGRRGPLYPITPLKVALGRMAAAVRASTGW